MQDTSGPFVASSGRRHVIRDWLSCLSDDVRYSLYNSEDAQNAPRGLVQFDKDTLQTIAGELYVLAMLENRRAFSSGRPVLRLHEHLYNLFFFRLGQRSYVEICLQVLHVWLWLLLPLSTFHMGKWSFSWNDTCIC